MTDVAARTCPVRHFDHVDPANTEASLRPSYSEFVRERIFWSDAHDGFWVLSGIDEVREASLRSVEFSSATNGVNHPTDRPAGFRGLALEQDPPENEPFRSFYLSWLSRGRIASFLPTVSELTDRYIDEFAAAGGGNFVVEVAEKLPVEIICTFFDLGDRGVEFRRLSQRLNAGEPQALMELIGELATEIADRREHPRGDFISSMLTSTIAGEAMSDMTATSLVMGAVVAGHETTLISGTGVAYELAEDVGIRDRLLADPSRIPTFVNECLRLHAPAQSFFRTMTSDVEIGGQLLRTGDRVMLLFAAANLDPDQFPDPTHLDVDRQHAGRHLSYGHGTHRCAGAALAEFELTLLTKALLRHDFRLAGPVGYGAPTANGAFLGFADLPLTVAR